MFDRVPVTTRSSYEAFYANEVPVISVTLSVKTVSVGVLLEPSGAGRWHVCDFSALVVGLHSFSRAYPVLERNECRIFVETSRVPPRQDVENVELSVVGHSRLKKKL